MRVQVVAGATCGKWLVQAEAGKRGKEMYYHCVCTCGAPGVIRKSVLSAGVSGCSGCRPANNATHGMTNSFEFRAWTAMRKRCNYPKHPHYKYYGGRGITVCPKWDSFDAFLLDMGPCPFGNAGSIDRIDPDKEYTPGNCRWILRAEQSRNRRNVPTFEGLTIPQLAAQLGGKYTTLKRRIAAGWNASQWGVSPQELGTRR
jgi:hypothetical protein